MPPWGKKAFRQPLAQEGKRLFLGKDRLNHAALL